MGNNVCGMIFHALLIPKNIVQKLRPEKVTLFWFTVNNICKAIADCVKKTLTKIQKNTINFVFQFAVSAMVSYGLTRIIVPEFVKIVDAQ